MLPDSNPTSSNTPTSAISLQIVSIGLPLLRVNMHF